MPEQTVQTQIRRHKTRFVIGVYTVCHSSNTILDISTGSKLHFFQIFEQE